MNNKILSVIVGVYNPPIEKFRKCITSILNQVYTELEIILLDDGSTNGAQKICDDYANLDHRVKVIHQKNYGAHAKFEVGYQLAIGDYITNVDHDDFLELDFYSRLMAVAHSKDVDVVDAGYYHHDFRSDEVSLKYVDTSFEINGEENIVMAAINGKIAVDSWCRIFKRDLIKKGRDWDLADPLTFIGAKTLVHIPYAGYHFVNMSGTTSSKYLNRWMLEQLDLFENKDKVQYTLVIYPFLKDYIRKSRVAWLMRCYFYMIQTPPNHITDQFKSKLEYDKAFKKELKGTLWWKYYLATHRLLDLPFKISLLLNDFRMRGKGNYD